MSSRAQPNSGGIVSAILFAILLWGASNTGGKFIVGYWPPLWTACTRFLGAGILLLALTRFTSWLGKPKPISSADQKSLWLESGLNLAIYLVAFYWALKFTAVSHIALYLGASPVWALLWEGRPNRSWQTVQRYGSALLALCGVVILFWPVLRQPSARWLGEAMGLAASILWTNYGRLCRKLSGRLSGVEITTQTMWRAGVYLIPLALVEWMQRPIPLRFDVSMVQIYCIIGGSVLPFTIWNYALGHWPTSRVYLFNNLIPLSTMTWAHLMLGEPMTSTFWFAMALILVAVLIAQTDWKKLWPAPMEG